VKRLARLIFNRWVLGVIGLVAAACVIWYVGPTISVKNFYPFEAEWVRWIQIAILVLAPIVRWAWRFITARRANKALENGILQAGAAKPDASAAEVAQLRQRFEQAVDLLRKRSFGGEKPSLWARIRALGSKQYLYDLPWYVFIGAPGSGKTTALLNSGLRFPLAGRLGKEAVRGVGGTRDCDWWFTDEAVFLDTAGRYTTQQSNEEVDAGAWKGFLGLLKKARPRRPVNGVLVTVSVGDLLLQSTAEREAHTQALRARVNELYADLGVRLPLYLLVTKADLLAGFSEFFGDLGKEERAQVWGFSFPQGDQRLDPAMIAAELEHLEQRLYERLPERLEEERDAAKRILLYGFPQQLGLLRDRLVGFVETTFSATQFDAPPLLRGVYFTSGTQEGSPIDRVIGAVARNLGLERAVLPSQVPSGRSYFLTRFLREVLFPEAGLAGTNLREERRRWWIQVTSIGAATAALVLAGATWWVSYLHNRDYIEEVKKQSAEIKDQVAGVPTGTATNLAMLLPALSSVASLAETQATPDGAVPWSYRFGLYQGNKVQAATRAVYQKMLQESLLPSLTLYLDHYLRQDSGEGGAYDALKTYVMLYDSKHFNRDAAWRWYATRSEGLIPKSDPDAQKAFKTHFDALYERGWVAPPTPIDDALLARVRANVSRESLPNRIYDRLKHEPTPDLRDFSIPDKVGPKALLVFERVSRAPIGQGIQALYTKDGYYKQFAKHIDATTLQLAQEESWVLGTSGSSLSTSVASPAITEAVRRLYLEDYRRIWRQFVDDIGIIRDRDLVRTIEVAKTLSGADTPLRPLVKAIQRETTLSVPPESEPGLAGTVKGKTEQYKGKAREVLTGVAPGTLEKAIVDDSFEDIRRLAGEPGSNAAAPIDGLIQQINEFYQLMLAAKIALDAAQAPPSTDGANKLRAEVARMPEPLRSMLQGLVEGGVGQIRKKVEEKQATDLQQQRVKQAQEMQLAREKQAEELKLAREKQAEEQRLAREKQGEESRQQREKQVSDTRQTRERIDAELRAQIADFCVKAIGNRYPFVRESQQDVTPEDFSRLFAPAGMLDGFFQKFLGPHVDTSQTPWRFRDPAMGSSPALAEFQRAQVIREVFFRGGGGTPSIQLDFKPIQMDASIQQFLLDVDGKLVRYAHGPQVPVRVQFPGPGGRSQVRVSVTPPPPGSSNLKFEGAWALFRMFDEVKIKETNQLERFVATINVGDRKAVFEVMASSVRNPFRLPELTQFRCPTGL
jgi:type VI secretion system protein ImpL